VTLCKFNTLTTKQIEHCKGILETKGSEYVFGPDRLEHFKTAATAQGVTPKQALWAMVAKHIASLSSMCRVEGDYPLALWQEKITDTLCYSLLLWALVNEEAEVNV